jgi:RNA polymerase sigma-70 factor (ECF subfamily)
VTVDQRAKDALSDFYADTYARLVGVVAVAAGSQVEAEECVQEAFVRLVSRWSVVTRYEDPEAWVRTVAFRLLSNRRRKERNRLRALLRLGRSEESGRRRHRCIPGSGPAAAPAVSITGLY